MTPIQVLADRIQRETRERLQKQYPALDYVRFCSVKVRPGKLYTKVDVGESGKYMVVNATGEIFGIKAYGVIHRGHRYGTLDTIDQYYWGKYLATRRQTD